MIDRDETPHHRSRSLADLSRQAAATAAPDEFLTVFWRNRWIALLFVVATLTAGFVYIRAATPVYTSTAKLYLDHESIQISRYEPGAMPRTERYLHTQAEVLRSESILAAALGTDEDPPLQTFRDIRIPMAYLRRNMAIGVGRKDEIISVSFDSPYPVEAAQVVNRVVRAYLASRSEDEQEDATKVLRILESQLKLCKEELKAKRTELGEFQANDMPVSLGMDGGNAVVQGHLESQSDYARARAAAAKARQHLDGIRSLAANPVALRQYLRGEDGAGQYANAMGEKALLEARLTELELQEGVLLKRLTADHPAVVGVAVEKQELREEVASLANRFADAATMAAERRYSEAKEDEERLAEQYEQQSEKVRQLSTELHRSRQLQAEVDRLDASVATFEQEVGEIRKIVGEDVGRMRMAALEPARPAEKPSAPQKGRVMAMALILGLILGGGVAVVRDWADQTFRSVEDISAALDLAVLGTVPAMARRQNEQMRRQKVLAQPESPEAEAFRTVRTALFFGASAEQMRTLLITSPAAGDGKSTVVSNLSITMAQAGQNTLVLDADFRRPTQHVTFGMDHRGQCVGNVWDGRMKLDEAIQSTPVKGLSLLTCGYGVSNPAELLNSPAFAELLGRLAKTYDRVLVDAPPVTAVTDAQILGALCDHTILVLRAEKSTRRIAWRAVETLESVGANLLGVVVNAVRSESSYGAYHRSYDSRSRDGGNGQAQGAKTSGDKRTATVGSTCREA